MKIFLVRHGQTTGDVENRYGGSYDDHLSEEGKKQSIEIVKKLKNKNIKNIFSSSLIRAIETSEIISKELNVEFDIIDNLRERNQYGVLSGLTKDEAKEKFSDEVEKLAKHPYNNFVTSSENYKKFVERIKNSFNNLVNEIENDFLIVTHGGPIRVLFREVFNFGEFKKIDDCAIIEIEKNGDEFKLVSMDGAEIE